MKTAAIRQKKNELESKIRNIEADIEKFQATGKIWVPSDEAQQSRSGSALPEKNVQYSEGEEESVFKLLGRQSQ